MRWLIAAITLFISASAAAQDTTVFYEGKTYTLPQVIVGDNKEYLAFLNRIRNDTTFYKAFRNLRVLQFSAFNDIKMLSRKGRVQASLFSKTKQVRSNGCRKTEVLEEKVTGDFYDRKHDYNYFTAELYAALFFANEPVCGEDNIVKGTEISARGKKGVAKHKEQLKMLFFNPGKKIQGIPFIGDKVNIFEADAIQLYDFRVDQEEYNGRPALVFTARPKPDADKDKIVIDSMTTWFDAATMNIMARTYTLSYKAGVYDFNVTMGVEMQQFGELTVPRVLRYNGEWDVIFKKKERAIFTATLFDFSRSN
ncbi:MAG TPA: hypothetical protein VF145_04485 [Chitinophagaceae bacterium]